MQTTPAPGFDLGLTLRSGQFFRFRDSGPGFLVLDRDAAVRVRQERDALRFEGAPESSVRRLFGLDADHRAALAAFATDRRLAPLLPRYGGMRVMRQDPWQCLVSFVCSAMSNIRRITANVEGIAGRFGAPGREAPAFPPPRPIPAGSLRDLRLGWREPWIESLFATVTEPWLASLATLPFDRARAALVELPGVGVKVAECVMAFSLGFGEACPVDVWIRRLARRMYFGGRKVTDRRIAESFRRRFGPHTALAQQILFTAGREGAI